MCLLAPLLLIRNGWRHVATAGNVSIRAVDPQRDVELPLRNRQPVGDRYALWGLGGHIHSERSVYGIIVQPGRVTGDCILIELVGHQFDRVRRISSQRPEALRGRNLVGSKLQDVNLVVTSVERGASAIAERVIVRRSTDAIRELEVLRNRRAVEDVAERQISRRCF